MDLTESIAPKSDQINADDLMAGARTFTVEGVNAGSVEQPVNIHLVELPGRPYRPSKSMRRVLVAGWGKEAAAYSGRSLTLFRNPEITFGRDKVGGIEISAMSDLEKPLSVPLTVTRGRKKSFNVEVLKVQPQRDWHAEAVACTSEDALRALYMDAQAANASSEVLAGIQGMAANFATPRAPEPPSEPSEQ